MPHLETLDFGRRTLELDADSLRYGLLDLVIHTDIEVQGSEGQLALDDISATIGHLETARLILAEARSMISSGRERGHLARMRDTIVRLAEHERPDYLEPWGEALARAAATLDSVLRDEAPSVDDPARADRPH